MSKKTKCSLYVSITILAVVAAFGYYKLYWDISFSPTKDASFADGIYVPKNLEDCHNELDRGLSPKAKQILMADPNTLTNRQKEALFGSIGHFGLGMWMRNNWGLRKGGPLVKYFNELGIYHPDDMSSIIMSSYEAKLRGKNYDINEEVKEYKGYWEQMKDPNDIVDPKTGGLVTATDSCSIYWRGRRVIHEGVNRKTNETWLYELDKGWYELNENDLKLIQSVPQEE
jgi:hypothetical protein